MWTQENTTILLIASLGLILLAAGCAQLDEFFSPDPDTGVSPADRIGDQLRDAGRTFGLSPWAEIAGGALSLFGAGYLLFRKIRRAAGAKVSTK